MRILQLSDFHLRGDGKLSFRVVDTQQCLRTVTEHLFALPVKPDMIVITGDLADNGDEQAYMLIKKSLSPLNVPIYAVPGNHDRRSLMRSLLTDWCPRTPELDPYLCSVLEFDAVRVLLLDTMTPGQHGGACPEVVATWLEKTLQQRPDVLTLAFMHHPPFITGFGAMDEPFMHVDRLGAIFAQAPQVRLCCGHMHRPIQTLWQGRLAMTAPSVAMQIDMDLSKEGGDTFRMETPGYLLHDIEQGWCNSHVCQIPCQASFSGPHRFLDSENPHED